MASAIGSLITAVLNVISEIKGDSLVSVFAITEILEYSTLVLFAIGSIMLAGYRLC